MFPKTIRVDEILVDKIAKTLIKKLKLKVVSQGKHEFTNDGLTKFFVLSQSHLVIHSWPENRALHVDLMTCNIENELSNKNILQNFGAEKIEMVRLKY